MIGLRTMVAPLVQVSAPEAYSSFAAAVGSNVTVNWRVSPGRTVSTDGVTRTRYPARPEVEARYVAVVGPTPVTDRRTVVGPSRFPTAMLGWLRSAAERAGMPGRHCVSSTEQRNPR